MEVYLKIENENNVLKAIIVIPKGNNLFLEVVLHDHGLFQTIDESRLGNIEAELCLNYDFDSIEAI